MSDPAVTAYLTKLLCSNGGRLERSQLSDLLDLPEEQIEQILQDEPLRFPQSSHLVLARSTLRICTQYLRPEGEEAEEDCPKLHLCRHYLRGQCPPDRRPRCRFSHDVQSDHNRAVLKAKELSGLNEDEIKILLLQNDNQLLPEDCRKYRQDNCDQGEDCTRLHVCSYFAQGGCNRRFCRKSHNLLDSKVLLDCDWLSHKTLENSQMLCVLKSMERQQAPREGPWNEDRRDARGMSRGRGRGRPGNKRRTGSQDLLDGRSRERRNEGSQFRWRSSSRPPSQCSTTQGLEDEDYHDSDSSGYHGRSSKTRLDNLMDDWFTPNKGQPVEDDWGIQNKSQLGRAHVRTSAGVTQQGGARSVPPSKDSFISSRVFTHSIPPAPVQLRESPDSRLTSELTGGPYNTPKVDYGDRVTPKADNPARATQVPLNKFNQYFSSDAQERPKVSPRMEKPFSHPEGTASSGSKITDVKSGPSIAPPRPSTISSTPYVPSRENLSTRPKPTYGSAEVANPPTASPSKVLSTDLSTSRPVHLSTKGSSAADERVSQYLRAADNSTINPTKNPSTLNQEMDIELIKALESSLPSLSIASSTLSRASLYSTTESSRTTQPTLVTPTLSGHMGASSSPNVSVGADTPSRKLQANVKPIIKPDVRSSAQHSLADEDFDLFWQPAKATNSTSTQRQPTSNVYSVSPGKSSLRDQTPEICLSYVWKHCSLGGCCSNMHFGLPYRWQMFNGANWADLPNIEDVERAYCDPNIDRYQTIDFQTMKSGYNPVRRLTTPSSVTQPTEYALTTEWCWYWKNESGKWTEYGQSTAQSDAFISSDLETIYLSDPNGQIPFTAGGQSHIIDCREMKERNAFFMTEREVRRRPKFLDSRTVNALKGSPKSAAGSTRQSVSNLKEEIRRPHGATVPEIGYSKVLLVKDSIEFTNIVTMFSKTLSTSTVKKVWRVQNPSLWERYNGQKDLMRTRNLGRTVEERQLFHGTSLANVDAICSRNFDCQSCGTYTNTLGQGGYFTRDASSSHNRSPISPAGTQTMLVARVLVGSFTRGTPAVTRPPQSYDSCADNVLFPSIFVVFNKDQVYPEYILEYEEGKTCILN